MPVSRWARGDEVEVSDDSVERARRVAKTLGRQEGVMRPTRASGYEDASVIRIRWDAMWTKNTADIIEDTISSEPGT